MAVLKLDGPDGDLLIPESNDPEWELSVIQELKARLVTLEDSIDESGYKVHEECLTLVRGLLGYHGGEYE